MTEEEKKKIIRLEQIEEFKTKIESEISGKVGTYNVLCSCTTAAATAAKTVSTGSTFVLSAGQRVSILFSATNTANNPTLNVNGTGAKEIYYLGSRITSGVSKYFLEGTQEFIYDGTRWHLMGTNDTVNTAGATQDTSKLFLVGTKAQGDYGQSYSRSTCYIGTDGYLYSNGQKVDVGSATSLINAKYSKPSTGIPASDLASAVQESLTRADNAMPKSGGTFTGNINMGTNEIKFDLTNGDTCIGYDKANGRMYIVCEDDTGEMIMYCNSVYGNFVERSDFRLKDILSDKVLTAEQIASLPAVKFTWKKDADKEDRKEQVGTIAQEVQKILPEVVYEGKDGMLGMQYGQAAMVSVINLARTVVEQQKTIEALATRLEALEGT